ncbi:adenylate/guanylate cyclase domain-containing protein [Methylobacterium sp. WSM2598]|uniref:adenylate/guanylate cyclase domain-containing protein n=1 Tax=Methylobacterium sp. WSM2598 TaxID=398261 RepID=UPI00036F0420|nr:adenylate/guanylate cyclase domain-containing protein [Methylobacterium sp. WSM2598]
MVEHPERVERRLAAIFAADVAGYSRLMSEAEVVTLRALMAHREIMERLIAEHAGRVANTAGDSLLAEFRSVVDAVECAVAVQERLAEANAGVGEERALRFRIGVHVDDVVVRGGDLLGNGVNVAARLEQIAEPGGLCISGRAYEEIEGKLEFPFEDRGEQEVKNIARPIRVYALAGATVDPNALKEFPIPDKPSIAVLPFTNMSGDPEQDYFADGVVEEITAALSRVRSFFVIARNSTFTYKGRAVDVREVGRQLGVRYVLEGSVRRSTNRLRIAAQLIDAADGHHIWADRCDAEMADIFDLQDRVTEAVVGAIEPTITLSEIERIRRKRPDNLNAYECVMRALPAVWSQHADDTNEGLRLAERAIALDPSYPLPKALAAWCYAQRVTYMRTPVPAEDRERALMLAQQAASLDNDDPLVLTVLSAAYSLVREYDLGLTVIEKALRLDPNSAWAWTRSGYLNVYKDRPEVAIEHFQRALRLSPVDPMRFNVFFGFGSANFAKSDYNEAARWASKAIEEKPTAVWAYRLLTTSYANAGRLDDARSALGKFLEAYPGMTVAKAVEATPGSADFRSRYAHGLLEAGLPP